MLYQRVHGLVKKALIKSTTLLFDTRIPRARTGATGGRFPRRCAGGTCFSCACSLRHKFAGRESSGLTSGGIVFDLIRHTTGAARSLVACCHACILSVRGCSASWLLPCCALVKAELLWCLPGFACGAPNLAHDTPHAMLASHTP